MKTKKYITLFVLMSFSVLLVFLFIYMSKIDYERDEMLFKKSNHTSVITIYTDASGHFGGKIENYEPIVREEVCLSEYENKWVNLSEVPKALIDGFLCMEDRNFYEHNGVNIPRTIKALINHFTKQQRRFGASTLTQQVIKNISGDNELSFKRKLDEILRAYSLERNHSKDEILEMYLNIIPMGDRLIGVRSASVHYFGKEPKDLTLAESATLVAITNAPSKYHPIRCPEQTRTKRDIVLNTMHQCGYIDDGEYNDAINEELITISQTTQEIAPISWFSEMVIEQVKNDLRGQGMTEQAITLLFSNGGLKIYTTEDVSATNAIESVILSEKVRSQLDENQMECAMIIVNNDTGYISAVLGNGREKNANRLLNLATDVPHTPGSTLKPLALYAPLLDNNEIHWGSIFDDIPLEFIKEGENYRPYPQNLPVRYDGLTTTKDALKFSKNTVAIRLYQMLGSERIYSHLIYKYRFKNIIRRLPLSNGSILTDLAPSPLALGQLSYGVTLKELTDAYAAFPRDGVFGVSKGYVAVYDKNDNLILKNQTEQKRIYRKETARIMNFLLREVLEGGTAKSVRLKEIVDTAGKTGTSGEDKDRLFIGYTPYYTAGIWCAKIDSQKTIGSISLSHLLLWDEVMNILHTERIADEQIRSFSSGGLVRCKYCLDSGLLPTSYCKIDLRGERIEEGYFTADNMPRAVCESHFPVLYDALCEAVALERCFYDGEVKEVSLVKLPKRLFPIEIIVTDAQYMGIKMKNEIKIPDMYDVPYFYYMIPEGVYVGRSKGKKQKNSACYFHSD